MVLDLWQGLLCKGLQIGVDAIRNFKTEGLLCHVRTKRAKSFFSAAIGATLRVSDYVAKSSPLSFRRQMAP
jgi:hypothetical protein